MTFRGILPPIVLSFLTAAGAAELYDRVEAVVGGEPILRSELMDAVGQLRNQPGFGQLDDLALRKKVLNRLIDEKTTLARAETDSVIVDPKDVDQRVEEHVQRVARRQNMTLDQLAGAVRRQMGIDIAAWRERLRKQFSEQMVMQKMQAKYIGEIKLTPKEVERFYAENRDELPVQRQCVRLAHVRVKILPKMSELERARAAAVAAVAELDKGADFATLAARLSDDEATAGSGGDMGFVRHGILDPRLERVAYGLEAGEFSRTPLYTADGYHVVKLLDRRDTEIRPAHILFRVVPGAADTAAFAATADSLRALAKDSASFAALAAERSDDEATKGRGGDLGWFQRADLNSDYAAAIDGLEVGQTSAPVLIDDSWHVFRVQAREAVRVPNLADDWDEIEQYARSQRMQARMQSFVEKWRKEIHVDIRDPELRR